VTVALLPLLVLALYQAVATARTARKEKLEQAFLSLQVNLAMLLTVTGAALLIALRIAQSIERPLNRLAKGVEAMGEGDLETPIMVEGSYEIEPLARRIEELRQGLVRARRQGEERLGRLEALHAIDRAILTTLDTQERLGILADQVMTRLSVDSTTVRLVNPETGELELAAVRGVGREKREALRLKVGEGLAGWVAQQGQPRAIPDMRGDPHLVCPEIMQRDGLTSYLGVPLKVQDGVIGVLSVATREPREFTPEELDLFTTVGNQAAIAIQNARLHQETRRLLDEAIRARREALEAIQAEQARRRELSALYSMASHLAGASELDAMLPFLVRQAVDSLHITFCCIALLQDSGEPSLAIQARHPIRPLPSPPGLGTAMPLQELPRLAEALERDQPVLLDSQEVSLATSERHYLALDRVRSVLVVPICLKGRPLGLLILGEQRSPQRSPFDADRIRLAKAMADQTASAIHRARLFENLQDSYLQTVLALANAVYARDSYTGEHGQQLAAWAEAVSQELGCGQEEIQAIRWGALLHDVGKIGVPDDILGKPGPLSEQEWEIMRRHPEIGAEIVAPVKKLVNVAPLIRHHQEWWDGSGYPSGLKGEDIPLGARILAVVDAYGAIIDDRVYRRGRSHREAIEELKRNTGSQFDPKVVETFVRQWEGLKRRDPE